MFGLGASEPFVPTRWLADGDNVSLGAHTLAVRHCPGHTPGHVVFHAPQIQRVFVGDVLFAGSIGRTDFPRATTSSSLTASPQRLGAWATTRCSSRPWA